eukprot:scaffold1906_cov106-Isochrysis_galbana.AAC.17
MIRSTPSRPSRCGTRRPLVRGNLHSGDCWPPGLQTLLFLCTRPDLRTCLLLVMLRRQNALEALPGTHTFS